MLSAAMTLWIPKSRKTWAFLGLSSSIAAYVTYDRYMAKKVFSETAQKCKLMGSEPATDNSLLTLHIVCSGKNHEEVKEKQSLFKRYCAKLLTMAGVDYKLLVFVPEDMDKEEDSDSRILTEVAGKSHVFALDSVAHSILSRNPQDTNRVQSFGCDLSLGFVERFSQFFNQRQSVGALSDCVMRILQDSQLK